MKINCSSNGKSCNNVKISNIYTTLSPFDLFSLPPLSRDIFSDPLLLRHPFLCAWYRAREKNPLSTEDLTMFPVVQESMVAVSSAQVRRQSKSDAHKGATLRGSHHPASGREDALSRGLRPLPGLGGGALGRGQASYPPPGKGTPSRKTPRTGGGRSRAPNESFRSRPRVADTGF